MVGDHEDVGLVADTARGQLLLHATEIIIGAFQGLDRKTGVNLAPWRSVAYGVRSSLSQSKENVGTCLSHIEPMSAWVVASSSRAFGVSWGVKTGKFSRSMAEAGTVLRPNKSTQSPQMRPVSRRSNSTMKIRSPVPEMAVLFLGTLQDFRDGGQQEVMVVADLVAFADGFE